MFDLSTGIPDLIFRYYSGKIFLILIPVFSTSFGFTAKDQTF